MGLARITVIFSVISSLLLLLSQARYVLGNVSSAAVTVQDPPEDTDRKAIAVPLEKPSSSHESIPADEGFHHVVDLSLRRPIDHHFLRPIDRRFLPGETPHSSGRIGFPRRLRGEMRWIPTTRTPEADDVSGKLQEALAQDLTEVQSEEAKEWIPVEWKAKEEEHKRKKKEEREEDSDSDSDSDDEEEKEIKKMMKKKKSAKHEEWEREEGGLLKRFWAFLNRF